MINAPTVPKARQRSDASWVVRDFVRCRHRGSPENTALERIFLSGGTGLSKQECGILIQAQHMK